MGEEREDEMKMKTDKLKSQHIAELGIGEVATLEMLCCQVGTQDVDGLKQAVRRSVYWPQFVELAKAGKVNEDWLGGALGMVILTMAKNESTTLNL